MNFLKNFDNFVNENFSKVIEPLLVVNSSKELEDVLFKNGLPDEGRGIGAIKLGFGFKDNKAIDLDVFETMPMIYFAGGKTFIYDNGESNHITKLTQPMKKMADKYSTAIFDATDEYVNM